MTLKTSHSKVVPFTGEFYQETDQPESAKPPITIFVMLGLCLLCSGAALGASAVYNSPQQQQLRLLQQQSEQLKEIKKQLCN
ncbi:MAG: hypothetical protein HC815_39545 [Richelia sp. RM1_1_1]|nr:hypothetical protein [Richelia sp. RM1_1_1]